MNQDGTGKGSCRTSNVSDRVYDRWANGNKRVRASLPSSTPVYMVLTCPTTFKRTVFYVPAPPVLPVRARK